MRRIEISEDCTIGVVGDPHLGKKFTTGVPFDRRGEREKKQLAQFEEELSHTDVEMIIVMGDLFDKFIVDYETLYKTYLILCRVNNKNIPIYIIQGNHDVSRNTDEKSSLDVLNAMVSHLHNISIIREVEYVYTSDGTKLMLTPYYEFITAREVIESEMATWVQPPYAIFGHWEVESFGGNDSNLCPFDLLAQPLALIVTGHIHEADEYFINDEGVRRPNDVVEQLSYLSWCKVIITGSMQPYSFGEDSEGNIYVTMTLDEYHEAIATNGESHFHDTCVRLLLKDGEEPPVDVDALQFIYKKVNSDMEEIVEAKMEVFSFKELFLSTLKENSVSDPDSEELWSKYQEVCSDAVNT